MRQLNEFSTGYPTAINNSQSQEYGGALGPVDAEVVQGKDRLNAQTAEGLHRINVFINHFFKRTTLNPQNDIAQLKVRLNHLNLDFPFDNTKPVEPVNVYVVTQGGNAFGVTPTTDLSKGFDNGLDLPQYQLEIRVMKTEGGFKLEGRMLPMNAISEAMINSSKRENRIETLKKVLRKKKTDKIEKEKIPNSKKNTDFLTKGSHKEYKEKNPKKFDKINKM